MQSTQAPTPATPARATIMMTVSDDIDLPPCGPIGGQLLLLLVVAPDVVPKKMFVTAAAVVVDVVVAAASGRVVAAGVVGIGAGPLRDGDGLPL